MRDPANQREKGDTMQRRHFMSLGLASAVLSGWATGALEGVDRRCKGGRRRRQTDGGPFPILSNSYTMRTAAWTTSRSNAACVSRRTACALG